MTLRLNPTPREGAQVSFTPILGAWPAGTRGRSGTEANPVSGAWLRWDWSSTRGKKTPLIQYVLIDDAWPRRKKNAKWSKEARERRGMGFLFLRSSSAAVSRRLPRRFSHSRVFRVASCCGADQPTGAWAQSGSAGAFGGLSCRRGRWHGWVWVASLWGHTGGLQQGKPSPVEVQLYIPTVLLSWSAGGPGLNGDGTGCRRVRTTCDLAWLHSSQSWGDRGLLTSPSPPYLLYGSTRNGKDIKSGFQE